VKIKDYIILFQSATFPNNETVYLPQSKLSPNLNTGTKSPPHYTLLYAAKYTPLQTQTPSISFQPNSSHQQALSFSEYFVAEP
jgi:hypothetical protein